MSFYETVIILPLSTEEDYRDSWKLCTTDWKNCFLFCLFISFTKILILVQAQCHSCHFCECVKQKLLTLVQSRIVKTSFVSASSEAWPRYHGFSSSTWTPHFVPTPLPHSVPPHLHKRLGTDPCPTSEPMYPLLNDWLPVINLLMHITMNNMYKCTFIRIYACLYVCLCLCYSSLNHA